MAENTDDDVIMIRAWGGTQAHRPAPSGKKPSLTAIANAPRAGDCLVERLG